MSRRRLASLVSAAFLLACAALPAAAQRAIGFDAYALPGSGTLAIPVRQDDVASGAFADLDAAADGALSRAVAAAGFKGRSGSKLDLPGIAGFDRVLLLGIGKDEVTPRVLEDFGGLVGQDAARSAADRGPPSTPESTTRSSSASSSSILNSMPPKPIWTARSPSRMARRCAILSCSFR